MVKLTPGRELIHSWLILDFDVKNSDTTQIHLTNWRVYYEGMVPKETPFSSCNRKTIYWFSNINVHHIGVFLNCARICLRMAILNVCSVQGTTAIPSLTRKGWGLEGENGGGLYQYILFYAFIKAWVSSPNHWHKAVYQLFPPMNECPVMMAEQKHPDRITHSKQRKIQTMPTKQPTKPRRN